MIQGRFGELTTKQKQFINVLEVARLEEYLPSTGKYPGRPLEDQAAIAHAFVSKMLYNMSTTRLLLDQLESGPTIRRL